MSILILIVGLLLFIGLVVAHEFGHFWVARRGGVEVEEFGIFFPPRLYKHKTKAGWLFTINLLPLGGFVKLKGEHDGDTEPGTFGAASLWIKSKIMAAGVVMNLIVAFVMLTILAWIGMPNLITNQYTVKSDTHLTAQKVIIVDVEAGSPAAKAGLKTEDVLTSIGVPGRKPITINQYSKLPDITKSLAGKTVVIKYTRAGEPHEVSTKLLSAKVVSASLKTSKPKVYLGVEPVQFDVARSTWSAPVVAGGLLVQITALTFQGLGHAIGGLGSLIAGFATHNKVARQNGQTSASAQVAGPVGIYFILKTGSLLGYQFMLFIIATISLTLAIMNILPIPALDGGKLWITLVARGIKRPLTAETEEAINMAGFMILITLLVLVTIVDVKRY
jgi:regulator of sigma E protease